jgi:hypothetical protein
LLGSSFPFLFLLCKTPLLYCTSCLQYGLFDSPFYMTISGRCCLIYRTLILPGQNVYTDHRGLLLGDSHCFPVCLFVCSGGSSHSAFRDTAFHIMAPHSPLMLLPNPVHEEGWGEYSMDFLPCLPPLGTLGETKDSFSGASCSPSQLPVFPSLWWTLSML